MTVDVVVKSCIISGKTGIFVMDDVAVFLCVKKSPGTFVFNSLVGSTGHLSVIQIRFLTVQAVFDE